MKLWLALIADVRNSCLAALELEQQCKWTGGRLCVEVRRPQTLAEVSLVERPQLAPTLRAGMLVRVTLTVVDNAGAAPVYETALRLAVGAPQESARSLQVLGRKQMASENNLWARDVGTYVSWKVGASQALVQTVVVESASALGEVNPAQTIVSYPSKNNISTSLTCGSRGLL